MTSRKSDLTIKARLHLAYSGPEQPHEALVNLRDEPEAREAFAKRFGSMKSHPEVLAKTFGPPRDVTPKRVECLRKAWRGDADALQQVQHYLEVQTTFRFTIEDKRIAMEPKSLWSKVCFLFLRDYAAGKTAICANPSCHSPYFIMKRKTQKYCEAGPCTEQAQREQKREWWNRHRGKGAK